MAPGDLTREEKCIFSPFALKRHIFYDKVGVQYNNRIGENAGYIPDIY